ncbi:MAG: sulfite exporter TauE/SafE family protein [Thermoproteota archaeon]
MLDPIITVVVLVAVGLGAGTLGSMLGVGGGIIMVPALTFLGLPPAQTASTSLIAVASTSVSSTIEYSRQKRIDFHLGLEMAAFAIPGAVLGAVLSESLSAESFQLYFGIILILTGIYILYKNSILKDASAKKRSVALRAGVFAATFGAGMISSMFGVGGGIIFVPAMLLVLGLTMYRAAPTSQLTLTMTSMAGVITHAALLNPDYLQALALSVGAFAGAQIGARISRTAKEVLLQKLLGSTLMAVGLVLIAMAFKLISNWFASR